MTEEIIPLVRSMYDLSSCGIGVQRYFLESLLTDRPLKPVEETVFINGGNSNLISNPIVLDTIRPGSMGGEYVHFFGERAQAIRNKHVAMHNTEKRICNIVMRSMSAGSLLLDDASLQPPEYKGFLGAVAQNAQMSVEELQKEIRKAPI